MINIVLFEPEIPPNTGNIIRLSSNLGARLHLIEPFAFEMDDKRLRRAGLDYHEWATVKTYAGYAGFVEANPGANIYACSTRGKRYYTDVEFKENDFLLFGPESRGLPHSILASLSDEQVIRIPMQPESRSLNLSNAVAVIVFEAYRQQGFPGLG